MPLRTDRPLYPLAVLSFAAFLATLPMLLRGPSCGHDFAFHITSWLEAASQFAHGGWPRWAYTPAFNAGEPRFLFYPPLSWSLGALLGSILPWSLVPAAFTGVALTLSGLTAFRLARQYTEVPAATLVATLYLTNPYMLFTAYERSAFAELLAAAFLPLLLQAALAPRVRILPIALPITLLWLTNAPAAVMSSYALALITLIRLLLSNTRVSYHHGGQNPQVIVGGSSSLLHPSRPPHLALTTTAGTLLGLSLGAFYIVPAALERHFVLIEMAKVEGMRISDNFLFHHMPGNTPGFTPSDALFHDTVVRTASFITLILLGFILLGFILAALLRSNSRSNRPVLIPLSVLTVTIAFLLIPLSTPIWAHLPELSFLQFPWRLSALLAAILALIVALALQNLPRLQPLTTIMASFALAVSLITPAWLLLHQTCEPENTVPARVALFHSNLGTEPTDEYTPATADNDSLHPHDPPFWLIPIPPDAVPDSDSVLINTPAPPSALPGPTPNHLTLALPTPAYLILNRRRYPAWQIRLNRTLISPLTPEREDGLITLLLPAGASTIDLTLISPPDQRAGLALSSLAALTALALLLKRPSKQRRHP